MAGSCFTAQERRDLEFVYKVFDVEGKAAIEHQMLRKALRLLGFKISSRTVQQMSEDVRVSTCIKNSHSTRNLTNYEGFVQIVSKLQGASYDQYEEILQVNDRYDEALNMWNTLLSSCCQVAVNPQGPDDCVVEDSYPHFYPQIESWKSHKYFGHYNYLH